MQPVDDALDSDGVAAGTLPDTFRADLSNREEPMGGKRPDQHNIDPAEAGATDYKFRDDDEHLHEEAKQSLRSNPKEQPMIPEAGVNPAMRELREKKHESE